MTEPVTARARCVHCDAQPGEQLYGGGPWLVVHPADTESRRLGEELAQQARERGVTVNVTPIDEAPSALWVYTGLVMVMSAADGQSIERDVEPFRTLLSAYRVRRSRTFADILDGLPWYSEAGVVQLVATRALLAHRQCGQLMRTADVHHVLEDGTVDLLNIFAEGELGMTEPAQPLTGRMILDKNTNEAIRDLAAWGIQIDDAPAICRRIDSARQIFEDPNYSMLHRPVPGLQKNRFDIVLGGPKASTYRTTMPGAAYKAFMENGSRACRMAIKFIQEEFPEFARPENREGKKGLQDEFRNMYRQLRSIVAKLRE